METCAVRVVEIARCLVLALCACILRKVLARASKGSYTFEAGKAGNTISALGVESVCRAVGGGGRVVCMAAVVMMCLTLMAVFDCSGRDGRVGSSTAGVRSFVNFMRVQDNGCSDTYGPKSEGVPLPESLGGGGRLMRVGPVDL